MLKILGKRSIIYDLAAYSRWKYIAFTKKDEIIVRNGVKIMGDSNILNKLPISSSNLF